MVLNGYGLNVLLIILTPSAVQRDSDKENHSYTLD